jgi:DNA-binding NtrC family response regulator
MKEKVLIVEDEFVEANYLRGMLERAGYLVCGVARSVEKARQLVEREKPGLVLLDIFLSGEGTGIDLARQLKEQNIAFIYLSANSNETILNLAKATEPYGFLVKPFRENDLLVTLEIARYRHEHSLESKYRQEAVLNSQLERIAAVDLPWVQKLHDIGTTLQPYIPFDLLWITMTFDRDEDHSGIGFLRVGVHEYQTIGLHQLAVISGTARSELDQRYAADKGNAIPMVFTGEAFLRLQDQPTLTSLFIQQFQLEAALRLPLRLPAGEHAIFSFFSRRQNCYNADHMASFGRLKQALIHCMETRGRDDHLHLPAGMPSFEGIIGKSHLLLNVFDHISRVAASDTSILILGESGTGKELIASCIHKLSLRKDQRLVKVNCAAIPPSLIESELFGHEKGAFTGAMERRIGKFEQAHKGTIFLDEIGEMPFELQAKLLHVLQDREIERLGARAPMKIDVRVITATNRNLEKEVAEGRFRLDLYYRLNVIPIELPPLRDRKEDIMDLVNHFIDLYNRKTGRRITGLSEKAIKNMMAYHWPGNIRELEHVIERCVLLAKGSVIEEVPVTPVSKGGFVPGNTASSVKTMQENERDHIISVLKKCKGKIWGPGAAAEILNLAPTTLRSKMKKLGIEKEY